MPIRGVDPLSGGHPPGMSRWQRTDYSEADLEVHPQEDQIFAGAFGTYLPDCSNMCHEFADAGRGANRPR